GWSRVPAPRNLAGGGIGRGRRAKGSPRGVFHPWPTRANVRRQPTQAARAWGKTSEALGGNAIGALWRLRLRAQADSPLDAPRHSWQGDFLPRSFKHAAA